MCARSSRRSPLSARLWLRRSTIKETADGIYGLVVGAAVMVASHEDSAVAVTMAVLFTLVIYWGAERYARLVAERIHEGHRPSWARVRGQLAGGWASVTGSAAPLVVLAGARILGVGLDAAVTLALVGTTLLLCVAGWEIGRDGRLTGLERLASAVTAGMCGAAMIALKAVLH